MPQSGGAVRSVYDSKKGDSGATTVRAADRCCKCCAAAAVLIRLLEHIINSIFNGNTAKYGPDVNCYYAKACNINVVKLTASASKDYRLVRPASL